MRFCNRDRDYREIIIIIKQAYKIIKYIIIFRSYLARSLNAAFKISTESICTNTHRDAQMRYPTVYKTRPKLLLWPTDYQQRTLGYIYNIYIRIGVCTFVYVCVCVCNKHRQPYSCRRGSRLDCGGNQYIEGAQIKRVNIVYYCVYKLF